jgi:GTPase SAR1 family protein
VKLINKKEFYFSSLIAFLIIAVLSMINNNTYYFPISSISEAFFDSLTIVSIFLFLYNLFDNFNFLDNYLKGITLFIIFFFAYFLGINYLPIGFILYFSFDYFPYSIYSIISLFIIFFIGFNSIIDIIKISFTSFLILSLILLTIYIIYIFYSKENKIVFFGPSSSGKTTLFFKIYEQFKHGFKIGGFKILITTEDIITKKFLDNLRDLPKDSNWPTKTLVYNNYICKIKVSDRFWTRTCDFCFYDFPGETFNDFVYNKNSNDYNNFIEKVLSAECIIITVDPTDFFCDQNYRKNIHKYFELFKDLKDKQIFAKKNIALIFIKKDDFESSKSLNEIENKFKKDAELKNILSYFKNLNFFFLNSYNGIVPSNSSIKIPPANWDPSGENPDITSLIKFMVSNMVFKI